MALNSRTIYPPSKIGRSARKSKFEDIKPVPFGGQAKRARYDTQTLAGPSDYDAYANGSVILPVNANRASDADAGAIVDDILNASRARPVSAARMMPPIGRRTRTVNLNRSLANPLGTSSKLNALQSHMQELQSKMVTVNRSLRTGNYSKRAPIESKPPPLGVYVNPFASGQQLRSMTGAVTSDTINDTTMRVTTLRGVPSASLLLDASQPLQQLYGATSINPQFAHRFPGERSAIGAEQCIRSAMTASSSTLKPSVAKWHADIIARLYGEKENPSIGRKNRQTPPRRQINACRIPRVTPPRITQNRRRTHGRSPPFETKPDITIDLVGETTTADLMTEFGVGDDEEDGINLTTFLDDDDDGEEGDKENYYGG